MKRKESRRIGVENMDFRLAVAKKVAELTELDLDSVNRLVEIPPQGS